MRRTIGVITFALAAVAAGFSQSASFLETVDQLGLTNEDVRIAEAEAAKLYEAETVEVGADTIWQNPDSGAYGKVEILDFDGRCVTIEHVFRSGETKQAHRVNARRCKGEDGVWRIAAE